MNRRTTWLSLAIVVVVCTATTALGQFGRSRRVVQNDPPPTEFIAARWHFGTNGRIGHMGWSHNYPNSDQHLNDYLKRSTTLNVEEASFRIVELGSDEVFQYPFAYVSEPGEMELTDQEVVNLREFIKRGGFVLVDDFDGPDQWEQMRSQVQRALPDRQFAPVSIDHNVFRTHFVLDDLQRMAGYVPGGSIQYYGLFNDDGSIAILAGLNNDLANFWDWYGTARMPLEPAADAFRLGTNAVLYSMTH